MRPKPTESLGNSGRSENKKSPKMHNFTLWMQQIVWTSHYRLRPDIKYALLLSKIFHSLLNWATWATKIWYFVHLCSLSERITSLTQMDSGSMPPVWFASQPTSIKSWKYRCSSGKSPQNHSFIQFQTIY